jgi:hypothetical protein
METEPDFDALRRHAKKLYQSLAEHMSFEEEVLPTALRDVIGWGAALQAQMEEDHEKQRATLTAALATVGPMGLTGAELIKSVRAFAGTILTDMEKEERGLLQADFDAMASDGHGG